MATAKKDFEGFIRWLHLPENDVPSNVRRLANLVLANFDSVLETSRQRSQRSVYLANLFQRHLFQIPDTLPEIAPAAADSTWLWRRLHHLTVGPFRGFRHPEPFELQKKNSSFLWPKWKRKNKSLRSVRVRTFRVRGRSRG